MEAPSNYGVAKLGLLVHAYDNIVIAINSITFKGNSIRILHCDLEGRGNYSSTR